MNTILRIPHQLSPSLYDVYYVTLKMQLSPHYPQEKKRQRNQHLPSFHWFSLRNSALYLSLSSIWKQTFIHPNNWIQLHGQCQFSSNARVTCYTAHRSSNQQWNKELPDLITFKLSTEWSVLHVPPGTGIPNTHCNTEKPDWKLIPT